MTITKRLLLTLSLALLALLFVGLGGIWQLNQAEERFEYFNDNTLGSVRDLNAVNSAIGAMRIALYRHAITEDAKGKADAEAMLATASKHFDDMLGKYEREDISDDTDRKLLEADRAAARRYQGQFA